MNTQKETQSYTDEIRNNFNNFFLPQFHIHLTKQIDFLKEFNEVLEIYRRKYKYNSNPDADLINNLKLSYHKKSYDLLSRKYNRREKQNFDQDLPEFVREVDSYLNSLNVSITRVQDEDRFIVRPDDSFKIKFYKRIKKFFYSLIQNQVIFGNFFRKIFRRPLKEKKQWHHKVPLKNLTVFYLRDTICLDLIPVIEDVNKKISAAFLETWKADEEFNSLTINKVEFQSDIKREISELEKLDVYLSENLELIINKVNILYEDAYRKSGTVELPSGKFSAKKIEKKHEELNIEYETLYNGWSNTFYSLFEDWRLNKELYTLREEFIRDFKTLTFKTNEKLHKNILPYLKEIKDFLEEVVYRLNGFSGGSSGVKSLLYREKDRIHNKLSKNIIPVTSDIILSHNIPDLIDQMEYNITNGIKTLPESRAMVKTTAYDSKIRDSEIDYISPKEIITYSTLSSYLKASASIKSNMMLEINDIQKGLMDIDQIADFNLESALSMFKSDKNTFEDPLDIAIEGVNRAIAKENSVEKKLNDIEAKINKDLSDAVNKINDELIQLTKNENIIDIRLKIARTKTLQRTEELKQKAIHFVKNFFPIILIGIKNVFISVKDFCFSIRKKFGLAPRQVSISSEVSDFLAATENAVSRLPFVYQRLFTIEPLEDERFFEGRDKELSLLKTAYDNWKLKRYAPVIIYGEKGGGITTLLNFYFKKLDTQYNIIRNTIDKNIYNEKDFINFLKNVFKKNTLTSIDDTASYLNDLVTKQVVVIENLQNLFLKKVNGFICLKMLFELISKTNQNVFWIISSSLYAWEYLAKVINVADYFGYHVKIEKLTDEQMIDIIIKRHRISGYNIYFEPIDEAAVKKKYKKHSDIEIQQHLMKDYFSELNEFAKSNISLALLYWMRSTNEVTTDTIKIGSVVDLDFSFLNAMSSEKFFILHILLLHDGLTVENVVEIFNKPLKEIRLSLLVLLDDGIIIRKGDLYTINPLLYRQIVYLLQSKNIIH